MWLSTSHTCNSSCRIWSLVQHERADYGLWSSSEQLIPTSQQKWHQCMENPLRREWVSWTCFTTVVLGAHMGSSSSLSSWRNAEETVSCPQRQHLFLFPSTGNVWKMSRGKHIGTGNRWMNPLQNQHLTQLLQLQFTVVKQQVAEVEVTQNPSSLETVIVLFKVHPLYRHELH